VYDVIRSPPPWGAHRDSFGNIVTESVMQGQLNAQYVVEGFTAGTVTCAAGLALIVLAQGPGTLKSSLDKYGFKVQPMQVLTLCVALYIAVFACYGMMLSYLKQKIGGY
jgi:hypothetical protein